MRFETVKLGRMEGNRGESFAVYRSSGVRPEAAETRVMLEIQTMYGSQTISIDCATAIFIGDLMMEAAWGHDGQVTDV